MVCEILSHVFSPCQNIYTCHDHSLTKRDKKIEMPIILCVKGHSSCCLLIWLIPLTTARHDLTRHVNLGLEAGFSPHVNLEAISHIYRIWTGQHNQPVFRPLHVYIACFVLLLIALLDCKLWHWFCLQGRYKLLEYLFSWARGGTRGCVVAAVQVWYTCRTLRLPWYVAIFCLLGQALL